jgi:hypothetical protein
VRRNRRQAENGLEILPFQSHIKKTENADKLLCSLIFLLAPQLVQSLEFAEAKEPKQFRYNRKR